MQYAKWGLAYADFLQAYNLEEDMGQVTGSFRMHCSPRIQGNVSA
jgi:hypothetical protein